MSKMEEIILYPRISKTEDRLGFGLYWRIPKEHRELVKKISLEFREGIQKRVDLTQKNFGLPASNGSYPKLSWSGEKGLTSIVIGDGCPCVILGSMNNYDFHNVNSSIQALALIEMLSIYLNGLQTLE